MLRVLQRRHVLLGTAALAGSPLLPRLATAAPDRAYAYEWGIPWLPESNDDIDVVQIPADGLRPTDMPLGSPDKLLLLVAPREPVTRFVLGRWLRYRGVVLIGGTFRRIGGRLHEAPSGNLLPGGHTLMIQFDGSVDRGGRNPFLFAANIDFEAADSKWGDFLQTGTQRNGRGDNFDQWCDVYLQKIKVGVGHYGWSTPQGSWEPHSDFVQFNRGGVRSLKVADCDVRWGYQTFFTCVLGNERAHPDGEHLFRRVVTRAMPNDYAVSPRNGRICRYLVAAATSSAVAEGRYYPHRIQDWSAEIDEDADSLYRHFSVAGVDAHISGDRVTWGDTPRGRPLVEGAIQFGRRPDGVVGNDEIGSDLRITDAASLRQIARIA